MRGKFWEKLGKNYKLWENIKKNFEKFRQNLIIWSFGGTCKEFSFSLNFLKIRVAIFGKFLRNYSEKEKNIMNNYCGKYPVLFLDFLTCGPILSVCSAVALICGAVQRAYDEHAYLSTSNKLEDSEREECAKWRFRNFSENPVKTYKDIYAELRNLAKYLYTTARRRKTSL